MFRKMGLILPVLLSLTYGLIGAPIAESPAAEIPPVETATNFLAPDEAAIQTGSLQNQTGNFPIVSDAVYQSNGDMAYVRIPAGSCANLTASPIQVGSLVVWPMHERGRECTPARMPMRSLATTRRTANSTCWDATAKPKLTPLYAPERRARLPEGSFWRKRARLMRVRFKQLPA